MGEIRIAGLRVQNRIKAGVATQEDAAIVAELLERLRMEHQAACYANDVASMAIDEMTSAKTMVSCLVLEVETLNQKV